MQADAIISRINKVSDSMNTMFVGIVTRVDASRLKYDVQPVLNAYDLVKKIAVEPPILFECPMLIQKSAGFFIRIPYAVGDMVYVGVCKQSLDESMTTAEPHDNRNYGMSQFRIIDGVILGGLLCDEEDVLGEENANDLVIKNRKNGDSIIMLETGGINMTTGTKVTITSPETEVSGNMKVLGDFVGGTVATASGVTLDGHTHKYNPGPGGPTPSEPGEG